MTTTDIAIGTAASCDQSMTLATDSPITNEIAATDALVEIQSFQPTKKPA
jgi:hypothetical protein